VRQFPAFGVALALAQSGVIQLGVIHDPLRRETFFAERGRGAFVQTGRGRPKAIRVSNVMDMAHATFGMGLPRAADLRRASHEAAARLSAVCHSLRASGSAALTFAYAACGRLDGAYFLSLQAWDIAAGAVLLDEAGGRLSTPNGEAWRLGQTQIAASNGALHEALIRVLALGS
jgi:myo-inositol-1(or 4)-monophosphatase